MATRLIVFCMLAGEFELLSQLISCLFSLVQVTAAIGTGSGKGGGEGRGGGVRPALRLAWADMVTLRLMMLREEGVEDDCISN